jgi:hypothetical protein
MSIDSKFGRYCDGCGRTTEKISRIYKEKEYCSTCYSRVFLHRNCTKCQSPTRAHQFELNPICRKCETDNRTCLRCNVHVPRAGIRVGERIACPSCSPYFREKRPCAECGTLSGRLSRLTLFGFLEPTCDKCRNAASQSTCTRCRKARLVAFQTLDCKPYCKDCVPGSEAFHTCPQCSEKVVGGGNSVCQICYVKDSVRKSAQFTGAVLQSIWVRSLFIRYSEWLLQEHPGKPALYRLLEKHGAFFTRIDATFATESDLTNQAMLNVFGSPYMRRFLLASRFVVQLIPGELSHEELKEASELLIISNKLAVLSKKSYGALILKYITWLKSKQTATRTVRLYLRAAEKFCSIKLNKSISKPSQEEIDDFVRKYPGSRNSLARFLSFGRSTLSWSVSIPKIQKQNKVPNTVNRIANYVRIIEMRGVGLVETTVLLRLLAVSLAFKNKDVKAASIQKTSESQYVLDVDGEITKIPSLLNPYAREIANRYAISRLVTNS